MIIDDRWWLLIIDDYWWSLMIIVQKSVTRAPKLLLEPPMNWVLVSPPRDRTIQSYIYIIFYIQNIMICVISMSHLYIYIHVYHIYGIYDVFSVLDHVGSPCWAKCLWLVDTCFCSPMFGKTINKSIWWICVAMLPLARRHINQSALCLTFSDSAEILSATLIYYTCKFNMARSDTWQSLKFSPRIQFVFFCRLVETSILGKTHWPVKLWIPFSLADLFSCWKKRIDPMGISLEISSTWISSRESIGGATRGLLYSFPSNCSIELSISIIAIDVS